MNFQVFPVYIPCQTSVNFISAKTRSNRFVTLLLSLPSPLPSSPLLYSLFCSFFPPSLFRIHLRRKTTTLDCIPLPLCFSSFLYPLCLSASFLMNLYELHLGKTESYRLVSPLLLTPLYSFSLLLASLREVYISDDVRTLFFPCYSSLSLPLCILLSSFFFFILYFNFNFNSNGYIPDYKSRSLSKISCTRSESKSNRKLHQSREGSHTYKV